MRPIVTSQAAVGLMEPCTGVGDLTSWRKLASSIPRAVPTGSAVITGAGQLLARYVIHAVGPVWRGGQHDEAASLARAYHNSLTLAVAHACQSVAFPSLSTGAYGYPVRLAAHTALETVLAFVRQHQQPSQVRFVLFDTATYEVYNSVLQQLLGPGAP